MKHKHTLTPLVLSLAGLAAAFAWACLVPARAQTPPPDLIYELPLTQLHSSAVNQQGGYDSVPLTVDVNGDGLTDLMFSQYNRIDGNWQQYVYLNNGNGWDKVYECERATTVSPWIGDCDYRN